MPSQFGSIYEGLLKKKKKKKKVAAWVFFLVPLIIQLSNQAFRVLAAHVGMKMHSPAANDVRVATLVCDGTPRLW